jgi:phospholipid transport system substrate-binding protein
MKKFCLVFLVLTFLSVLSAPCQGSEKAATEKVKSVLDHAMEIQMHPSLAGEANRAERGRLIRKVIGDNFAMSEMAREIIRDNWDKIPPDQRSEFITLFSAHFQDAYTRMVLNFLEKEAIEYGAALAGQEGVWVPTTINRANEHIPVRYLVIRTGGKDLIKDVEIDGVSILDSYRKTFRRTIEAESFEGLLKKMRLQSKAAG